MEAMIVYWCLDRMLQHYCKFAFLQNQMEVLKRFEGLMGPGEKYPLPEIFMSEMLELNSQLFELENCGDEAAVLQLGSRISGWMQHLAEDVEPALAAFENSRASQGQITLLKECFIKLKYLLRIQQRISTFATRDKAS
ncbi:iron-sulfur cluster co-chaperone HscB C-terminal domain-containing protein [Chitinophaga caseinilytica]|uniref:Iron-sulfur cluster co-chaperone HscB C-terminal domain-containing protein n=1 Tax=Chitinophaga caseinilytica TaxID=2267521 RepID=A0ABZ2Z2A9_9BACT